MKFVLSFCFILISTLFAYTLANATNCSPRRNATLLYRRHVFRRAIKGLSQAVYVAYPRDGQPINPNVEIVDFCVRDHNPILFGARPIFAYSVDEDIGSRLRNATIILRGQESRGINSTVEFYGLIT